MLMDKTLGAASVVTEESLPELLQEMLQPHLEEVRRRGDEALQEERAKRKKVRKDLKVIKQEGKETTAILDERLHEDKEIVEALCRDTTEALRNKRPHNRIVGVGCALLFCLPPVVAPMAWQFYLTCLLGLPLAYLTITGNKILGTATSEEVALQTFEELTKSRNMEVKVSRFVVRWIDDRFAVADRNGATANDLFC